MKLLTLSLLVLTGCASNKQFETILKAPEQPICKGSKPATTYSLTIMALNQASKGVKLSEAKDETDFLTAFYDIFAYKVIPAILLESRYSILTDDEGFQVLHFREKKFRYVPEGLNQAGETSLRWGESSMLSNKLQDLDIKTPVSGMRRLPLVIASSPKGNELIMCPDHLCKGLKSPSGDEITEIDVYPSTALGTSRNQLLEVRDLDNYNEIKSDYFLFDLISKSQIRIGTKFLDNYFVVPKMDQAKICNEMNTWELGYPSSCFESGFKHNQARGGFNYLNPRFTNTYLSRSQAVACCEKMENGKLECHHGSSGDFQCEPNEALNQKYMDAVVRDYILNKSFNVEKKNSGKWSIYKITFDPEIMCKYARESDELKNN